MSYLVTSCRNILLGEEQKGNEQLICIKKYFHFIMNEWSCLEYYSEHVGVLNTVFTFIVEFEISIERLLYGYTNKLVLAWLLDCVHRFVFQKYVYKKAIVAFWKLHLYPAIRLSCIRVSFQPTMETDPFPKFCFNFLPLCGLYNDYSQEAN
jgi:hypothetical protein